ncbi:hypothetical protein [Macrococcus capreoli]|uniref:hypothetical protein n=1 Tax=Macrococcus capreoli TaxID=2982690 RepID=UPI003EE4B206
MADRVTRLDSFKPYTPQNLIDRAQHMIDKNEVTDMIIITSNDDIYKYLTTPMNDRSILGLLEIVKLDI